MRVASALLKLKYQWPEEIEKQIEAKVKAELDLIYSDEHNEVKIMASPIFGYPMDYHRFKTLKKAA